MKSVTLTCPSCGASLKVTEDLDRFACSYCGTEQIVRRSTGTISLSPVVKGLRDVRVGVDKTASELAIRRLKGEIVELKKSKQAFLNDANSTLKFMRNLTRVLIILGILALANGFGSIFTEDGHPVLYTLAGIICTPMGILFHSSTKQHIRESEEKLAAREQEITNLKAELKRHRKVVKA
jgi:ribosomal protein S27AE